MKLSEAIRLGAMLRPQGFGAGTGHGPALRSGHYTCAMMAAAEAVGVSQEYPAYIKPWPWLDGKDIVCPVCAKTGTTSSIIALCLNDTHHWTRERIADWVATKEPQDEPQDAMVRKLEPAEVLR